MFCSFAKIGSDHAASFARGQNWPGNARAAACVRSRGSRRLFSHAGFFLSFANRVFQAVQRVVHAFPGVRELLFVFGHFPQFAPGEHQLLTEGFDTGVEVIAGGKRSFRLALQLIDIVRQLIYFALRALSKLRGIRGEICLGRVPDVPGGVDDGFRGFLRPVSD
jgi:hypothetical protein